MMRPWLKWTFLAGIAVVLLGTFALTYVNDRFAWECQSAPDRTDGNLARCDRALATIGRLQALQDFTAYRNAPLYQAKGRLLARDGETEAAILAFRESLMLAKEDPVMVHEMQVTQMTRGLILSMQRNEENEDVKRLFWDTFGSLDPVTIQKLLKFGERTE